MIIPSYSQFRTVVNPGGALAPDGLAEWPVSRVREPGSGFGDTGSTLINIPKPARTYAPLSISCNGFIPDAVPFTPEYQWFVSSRSQDPLKAALIPQTASLRFVSAVGFGILNSVDGGTTWTSKPNPTSSLATFADVSAPTTSHRWAVGAGGAIIHSQDSGHSWQVQSSGTTENLTAVDFLDNSAGWAGGAANTVLYTSNGGTTWATVPTGAAFDITCLSFITGGRGIVAGAAGNTMWTGNNGTTWNAVSLGTGLSVNDIDLLSTGVGWAVCGQGLIYKTVNGGASYTQQLVGGSTYSLGGVCAVDSSTAYVVGEGGYIIKTVDGGTTWTQLTSGTLALLLGVKFVSATHGWVCGYDHETDSSVVLVTTDGGATWSEQSTLSTGTLAAIDTPRVNMGAKTFSGSITIGINSSSSADTLLTPELVVSTFKNCHVYVQRLSDGAIQWVDLLRAMVANTE